MSGDWNTGHDVHTNHKSSALNISVYNCHLSPFSHYHFMLVKHLLCIKKMFTFLEITSLLSNKNRCGSSENARSLLGLREESNQFGCTSCLVTEVTLGHFLDIFGGYISVHNDVLEQCTSKDTSPVKSVYPCAHINTKHFSITISLQRIRNCKWNSYVSCIAGLYFTFRHWMSTSRPQNYKWQSSYSNHDDQFLHTRRWRPYNVTEHSFLEIMSWNGFQM